MPRSRLYSNLPGRKPYPLLSKTPCTVAYIKPCKCSQFQPYVHLNPEDPDGDNVIGSLDPIMPKGYSITDEHLDYGEVEVSSDGLLHPETACGLNYYACNAIFRVCIDHTYISPEATWIPPAQPFDQICEHNRKGNGLLLYPRTRRNGRRGTMGQDPRGISRLDNTQRSASQWPPIHDGCSSNPPNYFIITDTPLPDGLHLSAEPCIFGCDEREERCKHQLRDTDLSDLYNLQLSKPMTLQGK